MLGLSDRVPKFVKRFGTLRGQIEAAALASDKVVRILDGKAPRKVIVVPDRLVNIVA